jgi:aspartate carbamoyltransferase catalytic subunit
MTRHIISVNDLTAKQILKLFTLVDSDITFPLPFSNPILATLFFEPSTRTRLSFESAMLKYGGKVISASDLATTSIEKGESLKDTIRIVSDSYANIIAIRHKVKGAVAEVAQYSSVPIINAGDGTGEHPTQCFGDLYVLWKRFGTLKDVRVLLCGDLEYSRAAHSLKLGLKHMGAIPIEYQYYYPLGGPIPEYNYIDAIYITRQQSERHTSPYPIVDYNHHMQAIVNQPFAKDALIMSPLPRAGEISEQLDQDPRAVYFEQAKAGVPIRKALLAYLLGAITL